MFCHGWELNTDHGEDSEIHSLSHCAIRKLKIWVLNLLFEEQFLMRNFSIKVKNNNPTALMGYS